MLSEATSKFKNVTNFRHERQVPYNSHSFISDTSRTKFHAPSSRSYLLNDAKQKAKHTHPSLFAVVRFHDSLKNKNAGIIDRPPKTS